MVRRYQQTITSDAYIRYSKDFYGRLRAEVITDKDFYAQLKVDQPTPLEPTGGQAFDMYTGEGVKLTWTDTGNYGYNVYLMVSGSWVKQNQSIIKTTEYIVGNLTTGVTYEFKITGVNGQGEESS